jgi:hypothetical protein
MKKTFLLIFFTSTVLSAQGVRVDIPILTNGYNVPSGNGALPQTLWLAHATAIICAHLNVQNYASCAAAPITTYTDSRLTTSCPTNRPIVQLPGQVCESDLGIASNLGFWYAGGSFDYFITSIYGVSGPYTGAGGGGGGGGGNAAGYDTQVIYNKAGNLAGDSGLTYNYNSPTLTVGGTIPSGTPTVTMGPHGTPSTSWIFDTYSPDTAFSSLVPSSSKILWPAITCSSGSQVYSPAINACINNGTANNPAGTSGQMQFNNGGVFFGSNVTVDPSTGNVINMTGSVNRVINVMAPPFNASGNPEALTCSGGAGQATLSCTTGNGFLPGQGIFVAHGGTNQNLATPATPSVSNLTPVAETIVIPTTAPYTYTVAQTYGFFLGVAYANSSLTPERTSAMLNVGTLTPGKGEYTVAAGGVVTFSSQDAGKQVTVNYMAVDAQATGAVSFTASNSLGSGKSSTTLIVSAVSSGIIYPGMTITGTNIPAGTVITAQPAVSFTGTGSGTSLTVAGISGTITIGMGITGIGVPPGTTITAQNSGTTGSNGTYTTSNPTTANGNYILGTLGGIGIYTTSPATSAFNNTITNVSTTYTYQVAAIDTLGGQSAASSGVTTTTSYVASQLYLTSHINRVTWPSQNATGYAVYRNGILIGKADDVDVWEPRWPYRIKDIVVPQTPNGHQYICINDGMSGTGSSHNGSNDVPWPTTPGAIFTEPEESFDQGYGHTPVTWQEYGAPTAVWDDWNQNGSAYGNLEPNMPTNALASTSPDAFVGTISSASGTSITMTAPLVSSVTSGIVLHDDTVAINAAIKSVWSAGTLYAGQIQIPEGTFRLSSSINHNYVTSGSFQLAYSMFGFQATAQQYTNQWYGGSYWHNQYSTGKTPGGGSVIQATTAFDKLLSYVQGGTVQAQLRNLTFLGYGVGHQEGISNQNAAGYGVSLLSYANWENLNVYNVWKGINVIAQWSTFRNPTILGTVHGWLVPASPSGLWVCNNIDVYSPQIKNAVKNGIVWRCHGNISGGNMECNSTDYLVGFSFNLSIFGGGLERCNNGYLAHPHLDVIQSRLNVNGDGVAAPMGTYTPGAVIRCGQQIQFDYFKMSSGSLFLGENGLSACGINYATLSNSTSQTGAGIFLAKTATSVEVNNVDAQNESAAARIIDSSSGMLSIDPGRNRITAQNIPVGATVFSPRDTTFANVNNLNSQTLSGDPQSPSGAGKYESLYTSSYFGLGATAGQPWNYVSTTPNRIPTGPSEVGMFLKGAPSWTNSLAVAMITTDTTLQLTNPTDTTNYATSGTGWLMVDNEVMSYTGNATPTNTLTVTRALNGTIAAAHSINASIYQVGQAQLTVNCSPFVAGGQRFLVLPNSYYLYKFLTDLAICTNTSGVTFGTANYPAGSITNVYFGGAYIAPSTNPSVLTKSVLTSAQGIASAYTFTAATPVAGAGAGVTSGPTTSVSGNVATFTGTAGQIQDSGAALTTKSGTPTAGKATCWKTASQIGYCSTQPDATGSCTCN